MTQESNIQNTTLTPDKELNILYIERLPTSSYMLVIPFVNGPFLAHHVHK